MKTTIPVNLLRAIKLYCAFMGIPMVEFARRAVENLDIADVEPNVVTPTTVTTFRLEDEQRDKLDRLATLFYSNRNSALLLALDVYLRQVSQDGGDLSGFIAAVLRDEGIQ